jgi:hypothetical protein
MRVGMSVNDITDSNPLNLPLAYENRRSKPFYKFIIFTPFLPFLTREMSEEFEVSFDAIVEKIDSADPYLPRSEFKNLLASYRYFSLFRQA